MYKLTVGGGLMREQVLDPAIATLKHWQSEGKLEIFETDRAEPAPATAQGWPGARAESTDGTKKRRFAPKKDPQAAANFRRIAAVIFPMRDSQRLNMSELNDVHHLLRHFNMERTIFVTRSSATFIDDDKRKKIQDLLKVSVMTPEETVSYLSKKEGWPVKKG